MITGHRPVLGFLLAVMVLLAGTASPRHAHAIPTTDTLRSPLSTAIGTFIYPPVEASTFTVSSGEYGFSVNLGCAGIDISQIMSLGSYLKDYLRMLSNLKSMALGLAVNYLIMSFPTLYNLIQNMRVNVEWGFDLVNMNCQTIRALAAKKRQERILRRAQDLCIQDKGSDSECNDGNKLVTYIKKAQAEHAYSFAFAAGKTASGGPILKASVGSPYHGRTDTAEIILANVSGLDTRTREILTDTMPHEYAEGGTKSGFTVPKKSVDEIVRETTEAYANDIDAVTGSDGDPLSHPKAKAMLANRYIVPPNGATWAALKKLRRSGAPYLYEAAKRALAVRLTAAELHRRAHEIREAVRIGATSGKAGDVLSEEQKDALLKQAQALEDAAHWWLERIRVETELNDYYTEIQELATRVR